MTRFLCIHDDGELYWTDDESLAPDDLVPPEEFHRYAVQLCNRVEELERTANLALQSAIDHHEAAVSDLKRARDEAQRACREAAKYIRLLPRDNRLAERTTLPMLLAMLDDASGEAEGYVGTGDSASGERCLELDDADKLPLQGGTAEAAETRLVDQRGCPLGPRALQTRQRILDATVALLSESSMRDLRVIDIARRIGSSPATFYQYFKDLEDIVLHLATEASEHTPEMVDLIHGDWGGQQGHDRGLKLVGLAIDHWDKYAPILRVRNNAADEGDERFREVRVRTLRPMLDAFAREIVASQRRAANDPEQSEGDEWSGGSVDATAGATALTSILQRLAMYHEDIEAIGTSRERIIDTAATLIQFILTSRR